MTQRFRPTATADEYVRQLQIALGQSLREKTAIYLDMNFWIWLRDADRRDARAVHKRLLFAIKNQVARGRIFCPISAAIFAELLRQTDSSSRKATAELVDELSLGVTLIDEDTRVGTEISYFLHHYGANSSLHDLECLVWTKLGYVLGVAHPELPMLLESEQFALQKLYADRVWSMRLTDMMLCLADQAGPSDNRVAAAAKLSEDILGHSFQLKSFRQAFEFEAEGGASVFAPIMLAVMREMAAKAGIVENSSRGDGEEMQRLSTNLLAGAVKGGRVRHILRTLDILAHLHAALRWNKGRKFRPNDFYDFQHASAAIAYCDAFFTETSLRTLVTQNNTALDKAFSCFVTSDAEMALHWIEKLDC